MSFSRDLLGGLVIILIAGVIGVLQNSVRSRPMTLIPRIPTAVGDEGRAPAEAEAEEVQAAKKQSAIPAADTAGPDEFTAAELAAGELPKERVKALMEAGTVVLVDARSEKEYTEGHLPGAINIPYEKFVDYYNDLLDDVPMESSVICYCRSVTCDLSDQLVRELKLMGYQTVVLYRGGWDEWIEAGYPVSE